MKIAKNIIKIIRDIIEVYIPILVLLVLFGVFILQVFFRYILNNPQSWTMEVSLVCFVWLVLLGASFALRKQSHVTFKMLYDKLPFKGRHILSIAGNIVLIVAFAILVKPTIDYINFMGFQGTYIFKISFSYVYAPAIYFIVMVIFYQAIELMESLLSIIKGEEIKLINRKYNTLLEEYLDKKGDKN